MRTVRPLVHDILRALRERHGETRSVDLNDIAEVIGERAVSYDEVGAIVDALETGGFEVGEAPTPADVQAMQRVIATARRLKGELQRAPTVEELAKSADVAPHVVRRALERAARAGRSKPSG